MQPQPSRFGHIFLQLLPMNDLFFSGQSAHFFARDNRLILRDAFFLVAGPDGYLPDHWRIRSGCVLGLYFGVKPKMVV
jgi:hypothetical protein